MQPLYNENYYWWRTEFWELNPLLQEYLLYIIIVMWKLYIAKKK